MTRIRFFNWLQAVFLLAVFLASAQAQGLSDQLDGDIDESAMFGEDDSIVESKELSTNITTGNDELGLRIGGEIFNRNYFGMTRMAVMKDRGASNNSWSTGLQADLFVNLNIPRGFKAYASGSVRLFKNHFPSEGLISNPVNLLASTIPLSVLLGLTIDPSLFAYPDENEFSFTLNEFFLDFNINHVSYFRIGKQVSKWGKGFFWNPSDLINIDRKDFTDLEAAREGVYGIRYFLSKPKFNLYTFLNLNDFSQIKESTLSLKTEFIIKNVELSVMGWFKDRQFPIFGMDMSWGWGGWNFYLEGIFSHEPLYNGIHQELYTPVKLSNRTKALIGVNKSFKEDRHYFGMELYYNGEGYLDQVFEDQAFSTLMYVYPNSFRFLENGAFYGAVFLNFTELFKNTTSLSFNAVVNMVDGSILLSPAITFSPFDEFSLSLTIPAYLGWDEKREITSSGQIMDFIFEIRYRF